jgi:acetyl-CoA C-acetyltransferase
MSAPVTRRRVRRDESTPAIVGVGQPVQRPTDTSLDDVRDPVQLMSNAARVAASDAGSPGLPARVGFIGVAGGWFRYRNPARLVVERIGAEHADTRPD